MITDFVLSDNLTHKAVAYSYLIKEFQEDGMKKRSKQILAFVLAAVMMLQTLPGSLTGVSAYAAEGTETVSADAGMESDTVSEASAETAVSEAEPASEAAETETASENTGAEEAAGEETASYDSLAGVSVNFSYYYAHVMPFTFRTKKTLSGNGYNTKADLVMYAADGRELGRNGFVIDQNETASENYTLRQDVSSLNSNIKLDYHSVELVSGTAYVRICVNYAGKDAGTSAVYSDRFARPAGDSSFLSVSDVADNFRQLTVSVSSDAFNDPNIKNNFIYTPDTGHWKAVLWYGTGTERSTWTESCNGIYKEVNADGSLSYDFNPESTGTFYGRIVFSREGQQDISLDVGEFRCEEDTSFSLSENFPDPVLRKCIFDSLKLQEGTQTVKQSQLDTITSLRYNATARGAEPIRDITGIDRLRNIGLIDFYSNDISDLSHVNFSALTKLSVLMLTYNNLTSLPDLHGTQIRTSVFLGGNLIPQTEFTKKRVNALLPVLADETDRSERISAVMGQASSQRTAAGLSVTVPDKLYAVGDSKPLFFTLNNARIVDRCYSVSVNIDGSESITPEYKNVYEGGRNLFKAELSSSVSGDTHTVKISAASEDGIYHELYNGQVTWEPDCAVTDRDSYRIYSTDMNELNFTVLSAKTIVSADIVGQDNMVYGSGKATSWNYNSGSDYDSRYKGFYSEYGIPLSFEYSYSYLFDSFTWKYPALPGGSYGIRVYYNDGTSELLADRITSVGGAYISSIECDSDAYNDGDYLYIRVYEKAADASKLHFTAQMRDSESEDRVAGISAAPGLSVVSWQYVKEYGGTYIIYKLKKENWTEDGKQYGAGITVHKDDGYDAFIGSDTCTYVPGDSRFRACYNSRRNTLELYNQGIADGSSFRLEITLDDENTASGNVVFNGGKAEFRFSGPLSKGSYHIVLYSGNNEAFDDDFYIEDRNMPESDSFFWEKSYYSLMEGTASQSFTVHGQEELSGNSTIQLLNDEEAVLLSADAAAVKAAGEGFDYTVSFNTAGLKAGVYTLSFNNAALTVAVPVQLYVCSGFTAASITMTCEEGELYCNVYSCTPELADTLRFSLSDNNGTGIDGAVFTLKQAADYGAFTSLRYLVTGAGNVSSKYRLTVRQETGGTVSGIQYFGGKNEISKAEDLQITVNGADDGVDGIQVAPMTVSGELSGIAFTDARNFPVTLTVTAAYDIEPLYEQTVTLEDVKRVISNGFAAYRYSFPKSLGKYLTAPDADGLYTIYLSSGKYHEEIGPYNLILTGVPATGLALDRQSLSMNAGASAKLKASMVPSYADDMEVTWSSSDTAVAVVAADGTVTGVKAGTAVITAQTGAFMAACSVTVTENTPAVKSYSIKDCVISVSSAGLEYDGTAKTPAVSVKYNGSELVENRDYTKTYTNNVYPGTAVVTIYGIAGRYTDKRAVTFTITKRDIASISGDCAVSNIKYSGKAKEPDVHIADGGRTLTEGLDYSLAFSDLTQAGAATVTVTGLNNYTGSFTMGFAILEAASVTKANTIGSVAFAERKTYTYNGSEQEAKLTVKSKDGTALTESADYIVTYEDNVDAGTAKATVTGTGDCIGTKTVRYRIAKKSLTAGTFEVTLDGEKVTGDALADQTYDGMNRPELTVFDTEAAEELTAADLKFTYSGNTKAGKTAKVYVKGQGNYTGRLVYTYKIVQADLSGYTVSINDLPYTGKNAKITEVIAVNDAGETVTLAAGRAVKIKYNEKKRSSVGEYTVDVTAVGSRNVTGLEKQEDVPYSIVACDLADCVISPVKAQKFKDGKAAEPKLTVKINGVKLKAGRDYSVKYGNNTAKGTATAAISAADGNANFTGTQTISFIIK